METAEHVQQLLRARQCISLLPMRKASAMTSFQGNKKPNWPNNGAHYDVCTTDSLKTRSHSQSSFNHITPLSPGVSTKIWRCQIQTSGRYSATWWINCHCSISANLEPDCIYGSVSTLFVHYVFQTDEMYRSFKNRSIITHFTLILDDVKTELQLVKESLQKLTQHLKHKVDNESIALSDQQQQAKRNLIVFFILLNF